MSDKKLMNGKIRVVENIGSDSEDTFGEPGTVLTVADGTFEDLDGFGWNYPDESGYEDVDQINEYFSEEDEYRTVFELVED